MPESSTRPAILTPQTGAPEQVGTGAASDNLRSLEMCDTADFSNVDGSDAAAVRDALSRTTFGHILDDAGIDAMCAAGMGRELLPNATTVIPQSLVAWIDPDIAQLEAITDKAELAWLICTKPIYGTCERRVKLIKSVADEGFFGAFAQAMLTLPTNKARRPWPWWYRPWRRTGASPLPNLFQAFGEG